MPHPLYGRIFWLCVLNHSDETFETKVQQLLADAYDLAVSKYKRQAAASRQQYLAFYESAAHPFQTSLRQGVLLSPDINS